MCLLVFIHRERSIAKKDYDVHALESANLLEGFCHSALSGLDVRI